MRESKWLETLLGIGRKIIPKKIFRAAQPVYHLLLAVLGAIIYRFPARKLTVIAITGTKGKSTTAEMVNAILEAAGKKTALANTIRYKIADKEWRNMFKMTLRGRFFTQKLLRQAVLAGCEYAVIEVSSEGVPQFRHKFLFLDALIFTNLAPEHIESHGSYENYVVAKLAIAKEAGALIINTDDAESEKFLALDIKNKIKYSFGDAVNVESSEKGNSFQVGKMTIYSKLPGKFNLYNMLGAIACAKFLGVSEEDIKRGIENVEKIRGRAEKIDPPAGGNLGIEIIVDYAHTPDSLKALYETYGHKKLICVLGNTGGGRDKWKRKEMGKIADEYCDQIILTNEDPYDEDPRQIVEEMKEGITSKPCEIIMDRREAINKAIRLALLAQAAGNQNGYAVLVSGKGTDPYIMGPNGTKQEWDDAQVAREELQKVLEK